MAGIFISYRREDTSGEASHLAADLTSELGRRHVFIDIDTIGPGVDYAQSIDGALTAADVVLVLIGDRWLSVTNAEGQRRLDAEGDIHVLEIEKALARDDVRVVPVLVEGAAMPTEAQLPPRIASLARRNALELTGRRWRYDVGQILGLVDRSGLVAAVRRAPTWAKVSAPLLLIAAVIAGTVLASSGGHDVTITSTPDGTGPNESQRPILSPATVPPAVDVCQQQLLHAVDGTVGPIKCKNGDLNQLAWETYAPANPVTLGLGPNATPTQAQNAICLDLQSEAGGTNPIANELYQLAELYYGWQFAIVPTSENC
jgi:hypothetical protein